MRGIKRHLKLLSVYAKMDLAWLLRDTKFAVLAVVGDVISNISAVSGIFMLAWRFGGIGGMNQYEVLLMLAYATMVTGVYQLFFAMCNVGHISRRIGRGQLEHMFMQPLPLYVQLTTEGFIPFTGSLNLMTGVGIAAVAIAQLQIVVTWWWILCIVGSLLVSLAIILGTSYLSSTLAFYMPVQAEEISSYTIDAVGYISNYPLSVMPVWLQIPLITVIPAGLLAWYPTLSLLGRPPLGLSTAYPLIFAIILCSAAAYAFRKGLRYYVTTGTNRYSAMGHRR